MSDHSSVLLLWMLICLLGFEIAADKKEALRSVVYGLTAISFFVLFAVAVL